MTNLVSFIFGQHGPVKGRPRALKVGYLLTALAILDELAAVVGLLAGELRSIRHLFAFN
jgi:hypothetical protein